MSSSCCGSGLFSRGWRWHRCVISVWTFLYNSYTWCQTWDNGHRIIFQFQVLPLHCSCNPDFSIVTGRLLKTPASWRWILSAWRTIFTGCTTSTCWSPAATCWSPGSSPCSTPSPSLLSRWWCTQLTSSSPSTSAWLWSSSRRSSGASPKAPFPSWTELARVATGSSRNLWHAVSSSVLRIYSAAVLRLWKYHFLLQTMACLITRAENQNNTVTTGCTVPVQWNTGQRLLCDNETHHLGCHVYLIVKRFSLLAPWFNHTGMFETAKPLSDGCEKGFQVHYTRRSFDKRVQWQNMPCRLWPSLDEYNKEWFEYSQLAGYWLLVLMNRRGNWKRN